MKTYLSFFLALGILSISTALTGCNDANTDTNDQGNEPPATVADTLRYPQEKHLKNVRQLTFGGNNAEAYFSFDGSQLVFQSDFSDWGLECDQIFTMPITGTGGQKPQMISSGKGRTTCAYFMEGDKHIVYASTHLGGDECPAEPERVPGGKYVWPIYDSYDIFVADDKGNPVKQLTEHPGYDAEATLSPDGKHIVFTSTRSGDLELWTMKSDGSDIKQVTSLLGYDGGAFFSPDGKKLVFRASRPEGEDADTYRELLSKGLVEPTNLEIFTCNVDGSDLHQVTNLGKANWAPFFHPSGEKIIFASNSGSDSGRKFNLFMVDLNGENMEQITFDETFDSFPMFSPDGKYLVFASNRFNGGGRDTNVFLAEWVD